MNNVEKSLENLIAEIKRSREYQEYWRTREELKKDPEKKSNVDKYRTRICNIQNNYGGGDLYYMVDQLENEAEIFRSDPLIDHFLAAELALCRMIQGISWKVIKDLDFELDIVDPD